MPLVIPGVNFLNVSSKVVLLHGASHCGACFGNLQVFLSRVPLIRLHTLCILLASPKISHFHWPWTLPFDGVVLNSRRYGVITIDRCFWLWMSHFGKGEPKNTACLTIVVQCPQLDFGSGRVSKEPQTPGAYMESPVQPNGSLSFGIHLRKNSHKLCCMPPPLKDMRHLSGCSWSCQMHGSGLLRLHVPQGNLMIACIIPMFVPSLSFVQWRWNLVPWALSCQLLGFNKKCFQQSFLLF